MESKLKRFLLVLTVLVMLTSVMGTVVFAEETDVSAMPVCYRIGDVDGDGDVDTGDAIGTLKHFLLNDPVSNNQNCDFDGDGELGTQDAIYVLKATFDGLFKDEEGNPIKLDEIAHSYYDPAWEWVEVEDSEGNKTWNAAVEVNCGCSEGSHKSTDSEIPVEITVEQTKAPTCMESGILTYTASWEGYSCEKTVDIPATGNHNMDGTVDCESGAQCKDCDYELPALGHDWKIDTTLTTQATCTTPGTETYKCAREDCNAEKVETLELDEASKDKLHHYVLKTDAQGNVVEEVNGCAHTQTYKCSVCGEETEGETYYVHTYTAKLKQAATCSVPGIKTFTCSLCGDEYDEKFEDKEAHSWVAGDPVDNVTTHTCKFCDATKTTVVATDEGISKAAAAESEIKLENNATMKMDEAAAASLDEERAIVISVDALEKSDPKLSNVKADKLEQIPETAKVYDISLIYKDTKEDVAFDGEITVSLPYTLLEGDDVDKINVWYIDDEGNLDAKEGTYYEGDNGEGFVTFKTTHFSYYTVTRLTNEERCALYGHEWKVESKAVTCTSEGYSITSCLRCGEVKEKKSVAAVGHNYQPVEGGAAATCEVAGYTLEECQNCHDVKTIPVPVLGHNFVENEELSVDASHTAAGKQVSVCSHCGKESVVDIPQQEHAWTVQVEPATCTTAGSVKNVCSCGAEVVISQTAPMGHDYDKAEWAWAEDYTEATATLICGRQDCGHTLELKAAVERSANSATCTSGGTIQYTATVSHNGKSFSNKPEAIQTAPSGHKPGAELLSSETQHYYVCSVCDAKLNIADHSWGEETVITAPSCVKSGKAAVECTVCGYEGEKTIPATGEHSYVNGVCSGCGHKEHDCSHLRLYSTPLDLSGYNVCKGAKFSWMTCDCGTLHYLNLDMLTCALEYEFIDEILENGDPSSTVIRTCQECDLKIIQTMVGKLDEDACTQQTVTTMQIFVGEELVAESTHSNPNEVQSHPSRVIEEGIDLSEYGLCATNISHAACFCGQQTHYWSLDGQGCDWIYDEENSTNEISRYTCSVCGGVKVSQSTSEIEGCTEYYTGVDTFYVGDELVYTMENKHIAVSHDFQISKYEMDGENCTDGIMVTTVCADCGELHEYYATWHLELDPVTVDLTGYGFCADSMTTYTCPCEEHVKFTNFIYGDTHHEWHYVSQTESEDGNVVTWVQTCTNCGYTVTNVATYTERDENCFCDATVVNTYTDGTHTITGFSYSQDMQRHDIEQTSTLVGKYCTDGIRHTETCKNCGMTNTWEDQSGNGHIVFAKKTYDVSHLNACASELTHYECLCGESEDIILSSDDGFCSLDEWVEGGNGYYIQKCTECGIVMKTEYEDLERIDECHVKRHYTYTLTREGMEPVVIEADCVDNEHAMISEFTLLNPDQGCDGGYNVVRNCSDCDYHDRLENMYGHETWMVEHEKLTNGEFCGELYYTKNSCACGEHTDSWTDWEDGMCNYINTGYSEEYQGEMQVCADCGGQHISSYTEGERNGCDVTTHEKNIYLTKDGELVAEVENQYTHHDYEKWIFTYEMMGETCDDGYTVTAYCPDCGTTENWGTEYGCNTRCVERVLLFDAEGICAPVYLKLFSCACGTETYDTVEYGCQMTSYWDEEQGVMVSECEDCGLKEVCEETFTPVEGETCKQQKNVTFTYYFGENEPVSVNKSWITTTHETITYFHGVSDDPNANPCETGYYTTHACVKCDYVSSNESWIRTGHERYAVESYDLTAEPYGMCGGWATKWSCACGENCDWGWNLDDFWNKAEHVGDDPDTGYGIWKCPDCGIQIISGSEVSEEPNSCVTHNTEHNMIIRDDEVLVNIEYASEGENHEFIGLSSELTNPEGTCDDGWTWQVQCSKCGFSTEMTGNGHTDFATQILELPEETCGGRIVEIDCACGGLYRISNEYNCNESKIAMDSWGEEIDGVYHNYTSYVCGDCGLTRIQENYDEFPDPCTYKFNQKFTYSLNGVELAVFQQTRYFDTHNNECTVTLSEGSVTCEDGIEVHEKCTVCGYTNTYHANHHHEYARDKIDLSQYGAEAGTALRAWGCACGEIQSYNVVYGEGCDLYEERTESWIPEASRGDFYIYTCAVTDPQCNFQMRMARYSVKQDDCWEVEYQTWQAYDVESGSYVDIIAPIPTGSKDVSHSYETTWKYDYYLDDGTLITESWEQVCSNCGTRNIEQKGVYTNNVQFERRDFVSAINNPDSVRERHYIREYGYEANGMKYVTREREDAINADGSVWWYESVYSDYCFDGPCTVVVTTTWSDGVTAVNTENICHQTSEVSYEWVNQQTCSQFGVQIGSSVCTVCGTTGEQWNVTSDPLNHCNMYWDDVKQMYVCPDCGLEFINPASGAITMEDLTERYGNGENYVIGYWDQTNGQTFNPTLSVILENVAEGENDQIILDFDAFTWLDRENGDAITAVSFNKALADEAAAAAVADAGYTGTYSLRFNFVIVGGGSLDYAITFDPVTTNNA